MKKMFLNAWAYRHYILSSIRAEFKNRFARSRIGSLWLIIHPLAQSAIFALVLSKFMAAKLPGFTTTRFSYPIYLLSGMIGWSLFSEVLTRSTSLFIKSANLLKKVVFPRICLPLIAIGSSLFYNCLLLLATLLICSLLGTFPGIQILWLVPLTFLTIGLALGLGLILGILNVFVRDIEQIIPIFLQLGFWLTPIVYTMDIVPDKFRFFLHLNPLIPIIEGYQRVILLNQTPNLSSLGVVSLFTVALLSFSSFLYKRASGELVDAL